MDEINLFENPEAVSRLGKRLFIRCPLYESKRSIKVIYLNESLFKQYISSQLRSWSKMAETIEHHFNITLDITQSTGQQKGWAYVDKQADPLAFSLRNNRGSGRAYYTGRLFNIKGEKTPLATSKDVNHANGVLSLEDGIWNVLIANTFYEDRLCKLAPILAIIDLDEEYVHPATGNIINKVKIIRLDIEGSLDRINHLFYKKKPISKSQLKSIARSFGELDGNKFIHRILHGSWSNGNISPQGHLIDYDSVCMVKGRQPQFNVSNYYIENFFSYEYLGKLKILKCLTEAPLINKEKVKFNSLKTIFFHIRKKTIYTQWIQLMGFRNEEINNNLLHEIKFLANKFIQLSRYIRYNTQKSFFINLPYQFSSHLFDFSNFFRYFPLFKLKNDYSIDSGLNLLIQSRLILNEETIVDSTGFLEEPLIESVWKHIKKGYVTFKKNDSLIKDVTDFIQNYNHLFDKIIAENQLKFIDVVINAYVINQDRFYLFPFFAFTKTIALLNKEKTPAYINELLSLIIQASKRTINNPKKSCISDMQLFKNGYSFIEITT